MRNFITKTNEWYDNLPTTKREIFFVTVVMGTLLISEIALWVYNILWLLPLWVLIMGGWRLMYLHQRKKTVLYTFDLETGGLMDNSTSIWQREEKTGVITQIKNTAIKNGYTVKELKTREEIRNFFKDTENGK